jgi:hypothetical protein
MNKHKCAHCGTDRKLISCVANGGAKIMVCIECLTEMKRSRDK